MTPTVKRPIHNTNNMRCMAPCRIRSYYIAHDKSCRRTSGSSFGCYFIITKSAIAEAESRTIFFSAEFKLKPKKLDAVDDDDVSRRPSASDRSADRRQRRRSQDGGSDRGRRGGRHRRHLRRVLRRLRRLSAMLVSILFNQYDIFVQLGFTVSKVTEKKTRGLYHKTYYSRNLQFP
jgi:hypothetical protein